VIWQCGANRHYPTSKANQFAEKPNKTHQITNQEPDKNQGYTYRGLQTFQKKLILFCVWADRDVLGSAKTGLKFKYEI
jgi:hypothetical protein